MEDIQSQFPQPTHLLFAFTQNNFPISNFSDWQDANNDREQLSRLSLNSSRILVVLLRVYFNNGLSFNFFQSEFCKNKWVIFSIKCVYVHKC